MSESGMLVTLGVNVILDLVSEALRRQGAAELSPEARAEAAREMQAASEARYRAALTGWQGTMGATAASVTIQDAWRGAPGERPVNPEDDGA